MFSCSQWTIILWDISFFVVGAINQLEDLVFHAFPRAKNRNNLGNRNFNLIGNNWRKERKNADFQGIKLIFEDYKKCNCERNQKTGMRRFFEPGNDAFPDASTIQNPKRSRLLRNPISQWSKKNRIFAFLSWLSNGINDLALQTTLHDVGSLKIGSKKKTTLWDRVTHSISVSWKSAKLTERLVEERWAKLDQRHEYQRLPTSPIAYLLTRSLHPCLRIPAVVSVT